MKSSVAVCLGRRVFEESLRKFPEWSLRLWRSEEDKAEGDQGCGRFNGDAQSEMCLSRQTI